MPEDWAIQPRKYEFRFLYFTDTSLTTLTHVLWKYMRKVRAKVTLLIECLSHLSPRVFECFTNQFCTQHALDKKDI